MNGLFKTDQVAKILGITTQTVRKWVNSGTLPAVKIGRFWYVKGADLDRMLKVGSDA